MLHDLHSSPVYRKSPGTLLIQQRAVETQFNEAWSRPSWRRAADRNEEERVGRVNELAQKVILHFNGVHLEDEGRREREGTHFES